MLNVKQMKAFYPQGSKGGQCVIFCREILLDLPHGLLEKEKKYRILLNTGQLLRKDMYSPQVGHMIVTNEGGWGHVAIINKVISKDKVVVSESNYGLDEKIDHNRVVNLKNTKFAYAWFSREMKEFINEAMKNKVISDVFSAKSGYELATFIKDNDWHKIYSRFANECRKELESRGVNCDKY